MPSVQRYLSGRDNLARTATLAASSVRASTAIERVSARRTGGGRVRLAGSYTGHEAAGVDVEIVSAGGVPRASVPQFVGVGNGQLTVQSVDAGAALQEFTVTLADLGIETSTAGLDVREVRIRARTPGSGGNALHITVQPAITRTATAWALLAPWSTSTATQTGPQWDFGGLPLSPKDELDAASPRIAFGFDPQVYRPWRKFKDGAWQFGLSPALQRDVPASTPVYSVTGGYVVTVSDGVATETFGDTQATPAQAAIVTFYDLLTVLGNSALVEVAGVVAADRTSGGQAAIDVPLRTSAWLMAMAGRVALRDVAVPDQAPTQTLTVRCINADVVGKERWSVAGDVSGTLAGATTGVPYASSAALFTIPSVDPAAVGSGQWSVVWSPVGRDEDKGEVTPSACLRPVKLGINARPLTVTFRYVKRPPAQCDCRKVAPIKVSDTCLGLGGGGDMPLDPAYQTRLKALYEWRADFVRSNVALAENPNGFGYIRSDMREVEIANGVTAELAGALSEIYEEADAVAQWDIELANVVAMMLPYVGIDVGFVGAISASTWESSTEYGLGDYVRPPVSNGRLYRVIYAGVTNPDEPDWEAANPIQDNGVLYEKMPAYWSAQSDVDAGAEAQPGNGWRYIAATAGTTGDTEPFWSSVADTVVDGAVIWVRATGASKEIHLASDVSIRNIAVNGRNDRYVITLLKRGGTAELMTSMGAMVFDDRIAIATAENISKMAGVDAVVRMVTARMDYCRTLAGIVPKSDSSTGDAGGCWIDHGDPFWWVDTDGYYLPAFTNKAYISSRRDADGKPYSTREFGFGLAVACDNHLKIGDSITLRIESVDSERPYRVGDEAVLQTIGAGAAWLAGGIDGTDVQTWRVLGSSAGLLPDYIVPTDGTAAPVYAQAGVALRLALGGIPFQLGDAFTFAIEAGQFRWRRDGGAWSAPADIPPGGQAALADGLQVVFEAGAAPSFVPGDAYTFAVHQPWAASNLQDAQATAWGWDGSDATMTIDLGAVQQIGAIALARYQLPEGAAVAAEVSQDGMAWSAPLALDVTRPVSVAVFHLAMAARFVRISVTSAPGGSIGWVWCGQPLATEHHASTCERLRRWASTRGNGLNAAALYAGAGNGWKLAWENALLEPDVAALLGLGDWAQEHDEPLLFVPHHLHPGDSSLVRWGVDALQVSDIHAYQPDNEAWRLMSGALDLEPVFA